MGYAEDISRAREIAVDEAADKNSALLSLTLGFDLSGREPHELISISAALREQVNELDLPSRLGDDIHEHIAEKAERLSSGARTTSLPIAEEIEEVSAAYLEALCFFAGIADVYDEEEKIFQGEVESHLGRFGQRIDEEAARHVLELSELQSMRKGAKPKTVPKTYRIRECDYNDLRDIAEAAGVTITDYLSTAIREKNLRALTNQDLRDRFERVREARIEREEEAETDSPSPEIARRLLDPSL